MFVNRFLPPINLSKTLAQLQTRFYVRAPFTNKLTHYLRRAQLIDSIRLALRSNSPNSSALLNDRLIDSFIVIHAIRSAPNADCALRIIQNLEASPHFSHTQATLHALATVLAKCRRSAELKTLIGDISSGRQTEKRVCTESYNIVMSVYAKKGKNFEAVETFSKIIDEGAIPNSRTYTVMIDHLVSCGKLDSATKIFTILPLMRIKRTLKQFSVLVEGFVGVGQFDEVKTLLNEMRNDGKFPGRSMRVSLQRMQEAGFVEETDDILREMLPDERIKSVRYCEDSSDEDEDCIFNNDCGEGKVDEIQLKPWLDPKELANALNEWSPEVVSVLEDAKFVWTTRLVCKVLRHFKSPETAWDFFCWVAYQPGYTHDVYAVERMMAILASRGHVELVDRLISKIRREGIRLHFSTIRLIIDFYGVSKKADAALKGDIKTVQKLFTMVRQSGVEPDAYMYKVLIQAYCKCERAALAYRVFEDLSNSNLTPDAATKELLVKSLWKEGKRKEAAFVEERCEEINDVLPLALRGHIWTVNSADLTRVYNIYLNSFSSTSS
ncbi:hypothetical protein Patl1_28849 [Pistacia atlantica]|uniref:Uncharacterized protein n=1 Tax=Pistacia atlantica TaxID=434234 RepID=A0ACC1BG46_9ROSI|nr:hypothetical protein Patl1_28849 [Pistacia atlantica]